MRHQVPVQAQSEIHHPARDGTREIVQDVACKRLAIVNVVFHGIAGQREWVLIDAGISGKCSAIMHTADARFGAHARPSAIVLTHGHFDHVGTLPRLTKRWNVPVYAHRLEHPYLNGERSYPSPDASVGGGLLARLAPFYPRGPIDISRWLRPLPDDGSVPGMPGWRWIHTPGHTRGHISLWRASDGILIAGDAVITTNQESAYAVLAQTPELHGPPMYYTSNWEDAEQSVKHLAALAPEYIVTGHGPALGGVEMREKLNRLVESFKQIAVPESGRYVNYPTYQEAA